MAGEIPDLEAQVRAGTGKGAARQARRDGMVPGIVFGGDKEPLPINIPFNKLLTKLRAGRFKATLFNLKVEGQEDVRVICRDVQRHVVKDLPTHVDLMRLKRTTKINLFIQVEVEGEEVSPGLKKGGVLTLVRPEVELVVTAGDIPDHITIDVSELEIGDSLTISSVKLPNGTKPVIDRDFVIAQISAPSGLASQDDDEDEDVAADEVPATEVKED
ncbi:50S ribosomal protein L25/general stress protein Ctc [uncultured Sulfitobacter sp.]|uniref:50S ribosomal protein L25/general stress protein Ctc n=1 Tax=uncultured Sulfitobacter sp. TaxID=191468 RepID=UPI002595ACE0|nr:50S ribosomal protein L25/general stress protein Ctc [uncultured Sulfitobacter sp.]